MEAKTGNGQDAPERKRAINLSAPLADAGVRLGEPDALAASPGDTVVPVSGAYIDLPPLGESAVFGTSLRGYTLFHMLNRGDGEAELSLTWLNDNRPELARMFTNRRQGTEVFREQFKGARVVVTNISETSTVRVRAILTP